MTALVVGIGNPERGDDAIGPLVAATVGALALPGVVAVAHDEPFALTEYLAAYDEVVVVDAARTPNGRPGQVHVVRVVDHVALPERLPALGTHGLGVLDAIELARALGRVPSRLTLVGIEALALEAGAGPSPAVRSALGVAVRAVLDVLGGGPDQRTRATPG